MGPAPSPKKAPPGAASAAPQPSSLQATVASRRSQLSSHTEPQRPPCHTSRRPAHPWGPSARRSRGAGPVQTSPASSLWSQLLRPQGLRGQSLRACSPPPHPTSSIHTGPEPGPNRAPPGAASAPPQPSSRQATAASRRSHPSSHTVPQRPPCHTSSRPAQPWGPEARRSRSWCGAPAVSAGALVDLACLGGRGLFFRELLWGVPAGRGVCVTGGSSELGLSSPGSPCQESPSRNEGEPSMSLELATR